MKNEDGPQKIKEQMQLIARKKISCGMNHLIHFYKLVDLNK